jgi:S1-C subfamily serine protease
MGKSIITIVVGLFALSLLTLSYHATIMPQSVEQLVERSLPSVVAVGDYKSKTPTSTGTGFLIDGHVFTNNHVIESEKTDTVIFYDHDGEKHFGKIVYKNKDFDIGVLKPSESFFKKPRKNLQFCKETSLGERVVAIGHPWGMRYSISQGVLSSKLRFFPGKIDSPLIQTDTKVLPGNSGGPLLSMKGCVAGINTLVWGLGSNSSNTVPLDIYSFSIDGIFLDKHSKEILNAKKMSMYHFGIVFGDISKMQVSMVIPGKNAAKLGIQSGDRIVGLDGNNIRDFEQFRYGLLMKAKDDKFSITIERDEKKFDILIKNS